MKPIQNNIKKWYGLHVDNTGETSLKPGELSAMKNWQITSGYNAKKRKGYSQQFYDTTTGVTATNLISNPHFLTGASGYTFVAIDETVNPGALELKADATNSVHYVYQTYTGVTAGHKYYARIYALLIDGYGTANMVLKNRVSGGTYEFALSDPIYKQGTASCILEASSVYSSPELRFEVYVGNIGTSTLSPYTGNAQRAVISEPMIIDLTALYGAGNEPDVETADVVFSDWFATTGTVDVTISNQTGYQIDGQWYGRLNGTDYHLFASNGHIYKNDEDGNYTDLGTLTQAPTQFFQFDDTKGIEQRQAGTHYDLGATTDNSKLGQEFAPERDMTITAVTMAIRAKTAATTDNVVCKLYLNDGTTASTLLATASNVVNGTALTTEANFFTPCTFYFDGVDVSVGNKTYFIQLTRDGANDSANYYEVAYSSTSQIAGVDAYVYDGTWDPLTGDLWFQIGVKPQYSVYIINGQGEYYKWTGFGDIQEVDGYIPIVMTSTTPAGVGTLLDGINSLTNKKRQFFNADGSATKFQICETGLTSIDYVFINGVGAGTITKDLDKGTFTLSVTVPEGINNIEVQWTSGSRNDGDLLAKTDFEMYGGKNDNRVFLFGDDSVVFYSELANGVASAEYFPVLNYIRVGSDESKVMDLAKHFDRLIIFKENSTYWSQYVYDETLGVQFPVYPLNDTIGCSSKGAVQIINNNPFTVHNNKVYQLVASNVRDERNMVDMGEYIQPLLDAEGIVNALTLDNQAEKEYWLILENYKVYVYNYDLKVWYYYELYDNAYSIVYTDAVTFGNDDGQIFKFSDSYVDDNGHLIESYMETGNMDYGTIMYRKMILFIWLALYMSGSSTTLTLSYRRDFDDEFIEFKDISETANGVKVVLCKLRAKEFSHIKFRFENSARDMVTITGMNAPATISTSTRNMASTIA